MRKIFSIAVLLLVIAAGCKKFEDFQTDPNRPTMATPDLLLNTVIQEAFQATNLGATLATRQMVFINEASNEQYYGWDRAEFSTYNNLRQVIKMEQEANRLQKTEYIPLVKFFKAYYFMQLTNTFGDVPYTAALKGELDSLAPVYDKQQDIFISVLDDLESANAAITNTTVPVQGDILYKGSMIKWKRLINSLSLRILMSLSLKENNAALNVKGRFAKIVNDPNTYPLMTDNTDNGQLTFFDVSGTRYPTYNDNDVNTAYYMEGTFVDLLKRLEDPRLFHFAEKAPQHVSLPDSDFDAYGGAKGSDLVDDIGKKVLAGEVSRIKKRYTDDAVNEPSIAIGYAETQFTLAEAVVRGWINGNAATYYNKGVQASMQFYKIPQDSIDTYLTTNPLPASGQLEAIMTQKYIASFMNSDWHFFFEQRRTGLPVFDVSGAGVLNNKKVPKRWMYPIKESQTNQKNVEAAINSQFAGDDNINGIMWMLKAE
ncbi:SusD/RagB family nutrient-binding outer membrane lipoprotein [Chitinophaga sp. S165]|uniref:SusD/RagB family nutrient-binding outer membrane lipoprotein n=1 Tax=Chitinophaga sp. S165 TaxID=2135462 RepID=UPI000D70B1F1|nr:SusD/RagB family nutrient-binding outer membrane lipoprotein [Chitinophaga sp. S165]PWV47628.1 SusD-like starch-binding protein associating with outer membrane [Chitinophaga sp. S165]